MARPPVLPVEEKVRVVLAVLAGELTVAAAARQAKVSEQSVSNWKRQFIETGRAGLAAGSGRPSTREQQLQAEVADLTTALGEAAVELRVWKKSAEQIAGRRQSAFGSRFASRWRFRGAALPDRCHKHGHRAVLNGCSGHVVEQ